MTETSAAKLARVTKRYTDELEKLRAAYGPRVRPSELGVIHVNWPEFGLEFLPQHRSQDLDNAPWTVFLFDIDGETLDSSEPRLTIEQAIKAGFDLAHSHDLDTADAHAEDLQELSERSDR